MTSESYSSFIFVLLFFFVLGLTHGFIGPGDTYKRKVTLELNPGLSPSSEVRAGVSVLHARALGENDTLHFVLCSGGAPALLLVHSLSNESVLEVDWPSFLSSNISGSVSVQPSSSVHYSSALVFTRLWEFDDGNITNPITLPPYELQEFIWNDMNDTVDYKQHTAELCGTHPSFSPNASLCLKFSAFEDGGREEAWPSLLHNANSSQLHFLWNGIMRRTNHSQFALELQTVSETGQQTDVNIQKSIDDEYTPSIFQISEWVWSDADSNTSTEVDSFSLWKPVVYRTDRPNLEDAAPCTHSSPVLLPQPPSSRVISAFFTSRPVTHGLNISFHTADESGLDTTKTISWTVLSGIGTPPLDFFSPLVITIMAVGLGTPLLFLILGGVYICIHKKRTDQVGIYQPIN